jgi:hypothetical protein
VRTAYAGRMSPEELRAAIEATLALARERQCLRFLADCSALEGGHSAVDLYRMAEALSAAGLDRRLREAVVLPRGTPATEDVRFWETACLNRGFNVRIFPDEAAALPWLHAAT